MQKVESSSLFSRSSESPAHREAFVVVGTGSVTGGPYVPLMSAACWCDTGAARWTMQLEQARERPIGLVSVVRADIVPP